MGISLFTASVFRRLLLACSCWYVYGMFLLGFLIGGSFASVTFCTGNTLSAHCRKKLFFLAGDVLGPRIVSYMDLVHEVGSRYVMSSIS